MNTSHHGGPDRHDQDFDARLRQLHGAALSTLDPTTLARLRAARHRATTGAHAQPARHRGGWWLATACSAVLAIGVGLHLNRPAPMAGPTTLAAATDSDDLLEQNPDLYVWLASENTLAMEQN